MGLKLSDLEDLTEGMIYDLIEEKLIDNSYNDDNIEVYRQGSIDDFFSIS